MSHLGGKSMTMHLNSGKWEEMEDPLINKLFLSL